MNHIARNSEMQNVVGKTPIEKSPIEKATDRLASVLDEAAKASEMLRDRLSPILAADTESAVNGFINNDPRPDDSCQVERRVNDCTEHVQSLVRTLQSLRGRACV